MWIYTERYFCRIINNEPTKMEREQNENAKSKCEHANTHRMSERERGYEYTLNYNHKFGERIIQFWRCDAVFDQPTKFHSLTNYSRESSFNTYKTFICQYLHNWSVKHAPLCLCTTSSNENALSYVFCHCLSCKMRSIRAVQSEGRSKFAP